LLKTFANHATVVRNLSIWLVEFMKLGATLHACSQCRCPICRQMVRLHYKKAGLAHARAGSRALYEGSRYAVHYTAKLKCVGSNTLAKFDSRLDEHQHFNMPKSLGLEGF
jgi:hypothetical protein